MNIYGEPIEGSNLDNGGTITGDLDVVGDLDCVNLNVSDTLTASTVITEQELEVEDKVIKMAVGNLADNHNLSLLMEYNVAGTKWDGLVRSKTNSEYYLLKDVAYSPTWETKDITNDDSCSLNVNQLTVRKNADALASEIRIHNNLGMLAFTDNLGVDRYTMQHTASSNVMQMSGGTGGTFMALTMEGNTGEMSLNAATLTIGSGATDYNIPLTRGTNGQVLQTDGSGNVSWQTPASGSTLQQTYDLSTSPQITTDVTNDELLIKSHTTNGSTFTITDSADVSVFNVNSSGTTTTGTLEADTVATGDWSMSNTGLLQNSNDNARLSIGTSETGDSIQLSRDGFPCVIKNSCYSNAPTHRSIQTFRRARGDQATPLAIQNGDWISEQQIRGYDGTSFEKAADIVCIAAENWTTSANGADLRFSTCKKTQDFLTERMRITSEGLVCIGDPVAATQYYMPSARGTDGEVLRSDGSGNLSFQQLTPAVTVDNTIPVFDGTGGLLQNTLWTIDDGGTLSNAGAELECSQVHTDQVHFKDGSDVDKITQKWDTGDELVTEVSGGGDELHRIKPNGDCLVGHELFIDTLSFAGGIKVLASLFTQTADVTVGNTTTETSILGAGDGFLTLPANYLEAGDYMNFLVKGYMDTTGAPNMTLRFKFAGVTVHTEVLALATIPADQMFKIDASFVIRTIGASGTLVFSGNFHYDDGTVQKAIGMVETGTKTINTTVADTIDITVEWGTAAVDNTITTQVALINIKH